MRLSLVQLYRRLAVAACFLLIESFAMAQALVIKTSVDKNTVLIGEQFKLKVVANFPADVYQVNWLSLPDTFPHFEVISRDKIDSSFTGNRLTGLVQNITLTSFDSGQWTIPSFPIGFNTGSSDTMINVSTDTVSVGVYFMTSDTSNALKDIKPIREVAPASMFWYWITGVVLLLLLIGIAIWIFRINRKNKAVPIKTVASAYQDAMAALEQLKKYDLQDAAQVKKYHSKLAEIFKLYFSYMQNKNRLGQTTGELLLFVKEEKLDNNTFTKLAAALRCGDAVKFAKYLPTIEKNKECLADIKQAIDSLNQ